MDDVRPQPVYPYPLAPEHDALLRRAEAELGVPFKINIVKAVPGSPGNVLAFGKMPPHLCRVALVRDPARYESVLAALRKVLTAGEGEGGLFDEADYLRVYLGPDVREITDPLELQSIEDLREERAIRAALAAA